MTQVAIWLQFNYGHKSFDYLVKDKDKTNFMDMVSELEEIALKQDVLIPHTFNLYYLRKGTQTRVPLIDDGSLLRMWDMYVGEDTIEIWVEATNDPCAIFKAAMYLKDTQSRLKAERERQDKAREERERKQREAEERQREEVHRYEREREEMEDMMGDDDAEEPEPVRVEVPIDDLEKGGREWMDLDELNRMYDEPLFSFDDEVPISQPAGSQAPKREVSPTPLATEPPQSPPVTPQPPPSPVFQEAQSPPQSPPINTQSPPSHGFQEPQSPPQSPPRNEKQPSPQPEPEKQHRTPKKKMTARKKVITPKKKTPKKTTEPIATATPASQSTPTATPSTPKKNMIGRKKVATPNKKATQKNKSTSTTKPTATATPVSQSTPTATPASEPPPNATPVSQPSPTATPDYEPTRPLRKLSRSTAKLKGVFVPKPQRQPTVSSDSRIRRERRQVERQPETYEDEDEDEDGSGDDSEDESFHGDESSSFLLACLLICLPQLVGVPMVVDELDDMSTPP